MTPTTPFSWDGIPPGRRWLECPVSLVRLKGPDTLRVLHGQTSQALEDALPGAWRSTCCLTPTARLRGLAEVLVEENGAWLAITAGDGPALVQALDRVLFPADQVELGPLQPGRWVRWLDSATPPSSARSWQPLDGGGGWWLGTDLLLVADTPLPSPWDGRLELSPQDAAFWRLQQGEPALPQEINDAFNPFELGLADRVSLSKGCYVGQETLAKLASSDGVKQQLRRWHSVCDPATPIPWEGGLALQTAEGERAGQITSCLQRTEDTWVGLAMVRRQALERPTLFVGEGEAAVPLHLSKPAAFQDPPTSPASGAGRRAGGG
jgi:folate-binding protein YgfZ